jgi:class 3 adenylate cyclase
LPSCDPAILPPPPAPAPLSAAAGERRHVAVLFADLAGFTQLTAELGAEGIHKLLDAFFSEVDGIIEREGGRVNKHIGDCVMGVFGAPIAHGNDPERAVRSAIAIKDSVAQLAHKIGYDMEVHIGVTSGVVVASFVGTGSTAEYAVTGESVNLASRLTDATASGEILIFDTLYRAL